MRIKEKLNDYKTKTQLYKLSQTAIICMLLLVVVEVLFQIPQVNKFFDPSQNIGKDVSIGAWIALWGLMFLQVTIIPIPMLPILVFCNSTQFVSFGDGLQGLLSTRTLFFVLYCSSASVVGSMVAYWLGKIGGRRAVKWIAGDEEEFDKWSNALNGKLGKRLYALTVLLPIFPDDILCIVVGAMKMDFLFFVVTHLICSVIGIYASLIFMRLPYIDAFFNSSSEGFPIALVVYSIILVFCISISIVLRKSIKKDIV